MNFSRVSRERVPGGIAAQHTRADATSVVLIRVPGGLSRGGVSP